jgi:hypothetical protein
MLYNKLFLLSLGQYLLFCLIYFIFRRSQDLRKTLLELCYRSLSINNELQRFLGLVRCIISAL